VDEPVRYGKLPSEKLAEENQTCRQIVKNISEFGVTQRQMTMIIYLLALELENTEQMQVITQTVKELCGKELFLTQQGNDGSTS